MQPYTSTERLVSFQNRQNTMSRTCVSSTGSPQGCAPPSAALYFAYRQSAGLSTSAVILLSFLMTLHSCLCRREQRWTAAVLSPAFCLCPAAWQQFSRFKRIEKPRRLGKSDAIPTAGAVHGEDVQIVASLGAAFDSQFKWTESRVKRGQQRIPLRQKICSFGVRAASFVQRARLLRRRPANRLIHLLVPRFCL